MKAKLTLRILNITFNFPRYYGKQSFTSSANSTLSKACQGFSFRFDNVWNDVLEIFLFVFFIGYFFGNDLIRKELFYRSQKINGNEYILKDFTHNSSNLFNKKTTFLKLLLLIKKNEF